MVLTETGTLGVSLSRALSGNVGVVAVCVEGRVGIDIEATGAAAFAGFDDVALHPDERCATDIERTRLWVRKEAVLKAHGTGLVTDPRQLRLDEDGRVLEGPPATVIDLDLGTERTCAVAVTPPGAVRPIFS